MDGVARQFKESNPVTDFQQWDDMLRSMFYLGISGYLERLGCRGRPSSIRDQSQRTDHQLPDN